MSPIKVVRTVGEALYGQLWQTEMANALGVSARAVRRWLAGDANPPDDIGPRLRSVIDQRIAALREAKQLLPK